MVLVSAERFSLCEAVRDGKTFTALVCSIRPNALILANSARALHLSVKDFIFEFSEDSLDVF